MNYDSSQKEFDLQRNSKCDSTKKKLFKYQTKYTTWKLAEQKTIICLNIRWLPWWDWITSSRDYLWHLKKKKNKISWGGKKEQICRSKFTQDQDREVWWFKFKTQLTKSLWKIKNNRWVQSFFLKNTFLRNTFLFSTMWSYDHCSGNFRF